MLMFVLTPAIVLKIAGKRIEMAKEATLKVIDTLTWSDHATVVPTPRNESVIRILNLPLFWEYMIALSTVLPTPGNVHGIHQND